MTAPVQDDFTGTNGAAWNASKWTTTAASGSGAVTIQNNKGVLTTRTGAYAGGASALFTGKAPIADQQYYLEVTVPSISAESYFGFGMSASGLDAVSSFPATAYYFEMVSGGGNYFRRLSNNTVTSEGAVTGMPSFTNNTPFSIRARVDSNRVRFRCWQTGTTEPSTWQYDFTDPNGALPAGQLFVSAQNGSDGVSRSWTIDNVQNGPPGGAPVFTGSGSLAGSGAPGILRTLAVSGSGTVVLTGQSGGTGSFAPTGTGSLTLTGVQGWSGSTTRTGTGSITLSGVFSPGGTASVSGSGALALSGRVSGSTWFSSGTGALALTRGPIAVTGATATLTGSGALSFPQGLPGLRGTRAATGTGTLGFVGAIVKDFAGTFSRTNTGGLTELSYTETHGVVYVVVTGTFLEHDGTPMRGNVLVTSEINELMWPFEPTFITFSPRRSLLDPTGTFKMKLVASEGKWRYKLQVISANEQIVRRLYFDVPFSQTMVNIADNTVG